MKKFRFKTYNKTGEEIEVYEQKFINVKFARSYAAKIIANSMQGEVRNSRIKLVK